MSLYEDWFMKIKLYEGYLQSERKTTKEDSSGITIDDNM